jgi:replication-associated recombination protein RarA
MRLWDKHRPARLADLVGQPCLRSLLELAASPFPCALLFEGPPGTGKTSAALAFAAELGCENCWSGLEIISSVNLNIEVCRELFEHSLRLMPMAGNGWRVLVIEELDACSSATVQRYLKVALDTGMPPRLVVIATSNGTGALDPALLQRFDVLRFDGSEWFGREAAGRLMQIWSAESGGAKCPGDVSHWGRTADGKWSFREALKVMQQHLSLLA